MGFLSFHKHNKRHRHTHLRVAARGKDGPALLGVDAGEGHPLVPVQRVGRREGRHGAGRAPLPARSAGGGGKGG